VDGKKQTFEFPDQYFSDRPAQTDWSSALPRLWATRKIGHLLNQVRLNGADQETINQIVRLSVRYGIVTPYTSYLVTEDMPLGVEEQSRIAREQLDQMQSMPAPSVSGQEAVQKAADQSALAGAEAPAPASSEAINTIRQAGSHTYVFRDGLWVDTAFDPDKTTTIKVPFLSEDYFALAKANPDLAAGFALGQRVISMYQGSAYEVVEQKKSSGQIDISSAPTPQSLPTYQPDNGTQESLTPIGSTPVASDSPQQSNPLSCLGGLLPVVSLLSIGFIHLVRRK
jgi:Ca-activated chloride channel family protein